MICRLNGITAEESQVPYEALRHGRRIDVLLRRNARNDAASEDATYTGFDICWEDGQPAQLNLSRLCGIAVRQIFGDQVPDSGSHRAQFHLVPVENGCAPRLAVPRSLKPRRVYFERQGPSAALHLANGFRTDVEFHQDDDPRMVRWVGLSQLSHGVPQWVDMVALYGGRIPA